MDGQFVVRCVVNVVEKRSLFVVVKVGQGFELYFSRSFMESGMRKEQATARAK
jgi:hypothetical protein